MDSHEHTRSPDIRSQSRKKGAGQNIKKLHTGAPLRALYQSQFLKAVKAEKESKMKYALSHEFGETYFETLRDAIMAMYIMADHVPECKTTFAETQAEIDQISKRVNSYEYFEHGNFILYVSC